MYGYVNAGIKLISDSIRSLAYCQNLMIFGLIIVESVNRMTGICTQMNSMSQNLLAVKQTVVTVSKWP